MSLPCPLPLEYRLTPWAAAVPARHPTAFSAGAGRIGSLNTMWATRISIRFALLFVKKATFVRLC